MKKKNKIAANERGQSLTELAISFVFMILLLAGTVNFGQAFFTYIALRDSAQEGAAYASIAREKSSDSMPCGEITNRVRGSSDNPIVDLDDTTDIAVDVGFNGVDCGSVSSSDTCFGNNIEVEVTYANFPVTVPFLGTLIGQTFPIHASIIDTVLTPACQ